MGKEVKKHGLISHRTQIERANKLFSSFNYRLIPQPAPAGIFFASLIQRGRRYQYRAARRYKPKRILFQGVCPQFRTQVDKEFYPDANGGYQ
jgi:hypothetical protein